MRYEADSVFTALIRQTHLTVESLAVSAFETWDTAAGERWSEVGVILAINAGATALAGDFEAAILLFTVRSDESRAAAATVIWLVSSDKAFSLSIAQLLSTVARILAVVRLDGYVDSQTVGSAIPVQNTSHAVRYEVVVSSCQFSICQSKDRVVCDIQRLSPIRVTSPKGRFTHTEILQANVRLLEYE